MHAQRRRLLLATLTLASRRAHPCNAEAQSRRGELRYLPACTIIQTCAPQAGQRPHTVVIPSLEFGGSSDCGGVVWWCTEYVDGCDVLAGGGSCTRGGDGCCGDELCVPHAFLLSAPLPFCVRSTSPDWHGVRAAAATDLVDELGYGRGCTGGIDRREGQSDGSKDQREGHRARRNKRSFAAPVPRKLWGTRQKNSFEMK